jgi:hypothetical protein
MRLKHPGFTHEQRLPVLAAVDRCRSSGVALRERACRHHFLDHCFGLAIATFLVASVQHDGSLQMYSGVALMMIPIAGALLGGGAILASVLREALAKRKKKLNSREAGPEG